MNIIESNTTIDLKFTETNQTIDLKIKDLQVIYIDYTVKEVPNDYGIGISIERE